MKKFLSIATVTLLLFSCNNASKDADKKEGENKEAEKKDDKSNALAGTWKWRNTESTMMSESDMKEMQEKGKNKTITFNSDGSFHYLNREGDKVDTIQTGRYEIIKDGKFLISSTAYGSDTVEILELTDKIFKIQPEKETIFTYNKVE